jgi:hypothetical protein
LDPAKKVTRLPAGTGDFELRFFLYKAKTKLLEPAGRVPPDALLFASRQKSKQKSASPAEGISCSEIYGG